MKQINLVNKMFTTFIPKKVINDNVDYSETLGKWHSINTNNDNWLDDEEWCALVHTITKLTDDLIIVVFNKPYNDNNFARLSIGIYEGVLY